MRRRSKALIGAVAVALAAAFILPLSAQADDYPTWDDVLAAQNNESATANQVQQIQTLLVNLKAQVEATKADLELKAKAWQVLNAQYEAKAAEAKQLQAQAEAAEAVAVDSERRAGQWAAQVVRIGGADPTLSLFAASDKADELLSAIGVSSRISEQANTLYEQAIQQRNTAQSLTDQAEVMETELDRLKVEAEAAMAAAQAASEAASAAVIEQEAHQAELEAMLAVATNQRAVTEADYQLGVQKRAEEKLKELGVDWAQVSPSGWVRPAGGWISSGFGWREEGYHEGVDLAQSCWNPILAAHSGTVTRAGWYGGYGNAVDIDHGGGLSTRYGHQPDDGIQVSVGQHVEAGDLIGYVGTTGNSTGCHLHFEVRVWGNAIDPVDFMAANGIYL